MRLLIDRPLGRQIVWNSTGYTTGEFEPGGMFTPGTWHQRWNDPARIHTRPVFRLNVIQACPYFISDGF